MMFHRFIYPVVFLAVNLIYCCSGNPESCYAKGIVCFPPWFSKRIDLDPSDGVLNDGIQGIAAGNFSVLQEPPECNTGEVKHCVKDVIRSCNMSKTIYGSALQEYRQLFNTICDKASCFISAVNCQESVDSGDCNSHACFDAKLDYCLPKDQELGGELKSIVDAGKLFCQQQECVDYLESIPKGTCTLQDEDNPDYSLNTIEDICMATPEVVQCVLNIPRVCITVVDTLLQGLGLNFGSLQEVSSLMSDPVIKNFADLFLQIYFKPDQCVDCINTLLTCIEDIEWTSISDICQKVNVIGGCIRKAAKQCENLLFPSVRPLLNDLVEDLISLGRWLCGAITTKDSTCYIKSLECLNVPGFSTSMLDMHSFVTILGYFISGKTASTGFVGNVCSEMDSLAPCLTNAVDVSCTDYSRTQILNEFLVVDQSVRLLCWITSEDFSFDSLSKIPWFAEVNLQKVYRDISSLSFTSGSLQNYTIRLSVALDMKWRDDYLDLSARKTIVLKAHIEKLLTHIVNKTTQHWRVIVQMFYQGPDDTVIADFLLINNRSMSPETKAEIVEQLTDRLVKADSNFVAANESFSAKQLLLSGAKKSIVLDPNDRCQSYKLLQVCTHGTCVEENDEPVCKCDKNYEGEFCRDEVKKADIRYTPIVVLVLLCLGLVLPVLNITLIHIWRRKDSAKIQCQENQVQRSDKKKSSVTFDLTQAADGKGVSEVDGSNIVNTSDPKTTTVEDGKDKAIEMIGLTNTNMAGNVSQFSSQSANAQVSPNYYILGDGSQPIQLPDVLGSTAINNTNSATGNATTLTSTNSVIGNSPVYVIGDHALPFLSNNAACNAFILPDQNSQALNPSLVLLDSNPASTFQSGTFDSGNDLEGFGEGQALTGSLQYQPVTAVDAQAVGCATATSWPPKSKIGEKSTKKASRHLPSFLMGGRVYSSDVPQDQAVIGPLGPGTVHLPYSGFQPVVMSADGLVPFAAAPPNVEPHAVYCRNTGKADDAGSDRLTPSETV